MPDAGSRGQVLFEASGGTAPTGWSENFFAPSGMDPQSFRDYLIDNYVPKRQQLMGIGAFVQAVVAKKIPPNRTSSIAFVAPPKGGINSREYSNPGPDDYDPTQVDLLLRMETASGKRRQFWLGGLPDSVTDQLLEQGLKAAFLFSAAFIQWIKVVTGGVISIRFRATVGPPPTFNSEIITKVQPIMVRNRKRGRPFFLFRGRRLA